MSEVAAEMATNAYYVTLEFDFNYILLSILTIKSLPK